MEIQGREAREVTVFWRSNVSTINIIAVLLDLLIINHCDVPFSDVYSLQ